MKQIIHNRHSFEGDFEMIDGDPAGKGKITYYYGDLEEFKKHNLKLEFDIYEGEFKKGKANGKGKLTDSGNFFTFEGNFVDDEFVEGIQKSMVGITYEGFFKDRLLHGKGKKIYSDGTIQEGDFIKGIAHGKIIDTYLDGTIFEGMYKNGIKEGEGKLTKPNGSFWEGIFKDENLLDGTASVVDGLGTRRNYIFKDGKSHQSNN